MDLRALAKKGKLFAAERARDRFEPTIDFSILALDIHRIGLT